MALTAFVMILAVGIVAWPAFGLTAETRTAGEVVIGPAERIAEDVYIAAGTVEFNGQAGRDVNIAAGEATIDGTIGGSAQLATGQTEITGTIDELLQEPDLEAATADWEDLNRYIVESAAVAPYGHRKLSTFVSDRIDFEATQFHPVYNNDYTSFALKEGE